jgi:hypothetical protein
MMPINATMYKEIMEQNNEEMDQVMQIGFPLIPCPDTISSDSVIELFQCSAKKEFYIEITWTGNLYILPLDHTLTFQYVIDYIISCIPEIATFINQGFKFEYELEHAYNTEIYASTETILRAPMTEIPLSQGILHYIIPIKRTLDNHRWFVNQFAEEPITKQLTVSIKEPMNKNQLINYCKVFGENIIIIAVAFTILSHLNRHNHALFTILLFSIIVLSIGVKVKTLHEKQNEDQSDSEEDENELEKKQVYMCFSLPAFLKRNTHYIFSGTKDQLRSAFHKLQKKNDINELDTMPLDTLCDDLCHCESELDKSSNYDCSEWQLRAFASQNELDDYAKVIMMQGYCNDGYWNDIIYI